MSIFLKSQLSDGVEMRRWRRKREEEEKDRRRGVGLEKKRVRGASTSTSSSSASSALLLLLLLLSPLSKYSLLASHRIGQHLSLLSQSASFQSLPYTLTLSLSSRTPKNPPALPWLAPSGVPSSAEFHGSVARQSACQNTGSHG
ncbi:uncharacterized protein BO88DRAFT_93403 [Aspergillus vadensis CBS 113365]|uniref:Uncharacterized protein n=1 Tax=Aspergillus vadensis (strain CBS 113365 / IMI 142717 / IBT 24658) TaxID=1448311 RepID=A0A319BLZ3_ASPVC|nr:hypothetical protein BO88DRAFT_93403 [Aspergillus vadensis CBS 113365]PYH73371.1 hypothetical protein BO88DRAFT_93403 [Aspergillus vadensis CBS 113365]